jgi:hypothetical protein
MNENIKILNKKEHQSLKYTPVTDFSFAKSLTIIPITYSEVKHLCCLYPVVITEIDGNDTLAIITGLKDHNIAIDENGKFRGKYIPAYLRKYPFILVNDTENEKLLLGLKDDADCFDNDEGEALYDAQGNVMPLVENIMSLLKNFESEIQITKNILTKFKEQHLLEPSQIKVNLDDTEHTIGGFSVIDKELFLTLEDQFLADAVKNGWTEFIELHRLSLNNLSILTKGIEKHLKG